MSGCNPSGAGLLIIALLVIAAAMFRSPNDSDNGRGR